MRRRLRFSLLAISAFLAGCGTDVSGPSASLFACAFQDPLRLAVGEVLQVEGTEARGVCLGADQQTELLFIPFFAAAAPDEDEPERTLRVTIRGAGFSQPSSSDPAPLLAASRAPAGQDFHQWLRQREIDELERMIRPGAPVADLRASARGSALQAEPSLEPPEPGALVDLNVAISCTEQDLRTGRVRHVSEHAVVVADTANPVDLADEDYAFFGVTFDTLVHPVVAAHFGEPSDIDDNGRAIIFLTRAVNELTSAGATTFTAGFFWSGDLFPEEETPRLQGCPASNQGELFYVMAPDPLGLAGPRVSADELRALAITVIGHEYQHLINASRRLWINQASVLERPWLNEGLSHVAEELMFYAASGLGPGLNLTVEELRATPAGVWAFNRYMSLNFNNFRRYLSQPDTASLMGIDNLATRGATWSFLRYAADRSGQGDGAFFFDLVNSAAAGLDNLAAALPEPPLAWMQDWTVAVFADDTLPDLAGGARFQQPSWHLRDIYREVLGSYPLSMPTVQPGSDFDLVLDPGGAAYPRFGLTAGGRAALHLEADGATPSRSLRGSVVRIR